MVYQLSFVSTIPHSSYVQTISTLEALTGLLSPQEVATYTLVTKPHDIFKPKFEPGKVNQIEQYYMKCITTWNDITSRNLDISYLITKESKVLVERLFSGNDAKQIWTLQIADIPIAGKNQVCSAQTIYESTLAYHHTKVMNVDKIEMKEEKDKQDLNPMEVDIKEEQVKKENDVDDIIIEPKEVEVVSRKDSFLQFLEDLGYDVVSQYWIKGIRFFHGNIVIEIFKVLIRDDSVHSTDQIQLKLLDESNAFQIKVYINIPRSIDVELINQGTKELLKFKDTLKNLFKLEIPDRMYMDSRVIYK